MVGTPLYPELKQCLKEWLNPPLLRVVCWWHIFDSLSLITIYSHVLKSSDDLKLDIFYQQFCIVEINTFSLQWSVGCHMIVTWLYPLGSVSWTFNQQSSFMHSNKAIGLSLFYQISRLGQIDYVMMFVLLFPNNKWTWKTQLFLLYRKHTRTLFFVYFFSSGILFCLGIKERINVDILFTR